jgi:hypothetical protein
MKSAAADGMLGRVSYKNPSPVGAALLIRMRFADRPISAATQRIFGCGEQGWRPYGTRVHSLTPTQHSATLHAGLDYGLRFAESVLGTRGLALADEKVKSAIEGKKTVKVLVVKDRLLNVVVTRVGVREAAVVQVK